MKRLFISIALLAILLFSSTAYANSAAPIDLKIELLNVPQDAYVDILVNDIDLNFDDKNEQVIAKHGIDCENSSLYNYNEDNYIALGLRSENIDFNYYNLKNSGVEVNFYSKVPQGFKVIVQTADNEIVTSDYIDYPSTLGKYKYDFETNEIKYARERSYFSGFLLGLLLIIFVPLVLTIVLEVIVALIMKIKKINVIVATNAITNIVMNIVLLISAFMYGSNYLITLAVLEIIVVLIEYSVYKNRFNEEYSNKQILTYVIIANAVSLLVPLAVRFLS